MFFLADVNNLIQMYSFCARDCCFVIMNSLIGPDGIKK